MPLTAVVRDRGMQFTVSKGNVLTVNRLPDKVGSSILLKDVLCLTGDAHVQIGQPLVKGAHVECEVIEHTRGPKLISFKMKRRKNYRRKTGHRQELTVLRIKDIKDK